MFEKKEKLTLMFIYLNIVDKLFKDFQWISKMKCLMKKIVVKREMIIEMGMMKLILIRETCCSQWQVIVLSSFVFLNENEEDQEKRETRRLMKSCDQIIDERIING
jgi:hypothetical protein